MRAALATLLLAAAGALLGACGASESGPAPAIESPRSESLATLELRGEGAAGKEIAVDVADSRPQRTLGLSGRTSLPPDQGMLFVNEQDVSSGYHMKDTLIPLSLAFIAADGAIIAIVDMEPCAAEPCPVYEPPSAYRFGLEVNQGAFEQWGIEVGARATLRDE